MKILEFFCTILRFFYYICARKSSRMVCRSSAIRREESLGNAGHHAG